MQASIMDAPAAIVVEDTCCTAASATEEPAVPNTCSIEEVRVVSMFHGMGLLQGHVF
jgi:hypothetical protein